MRSFIDFSKVRPQHPDIVWVTLHPENDTEKKVLADNIDKLAIEGYFRKAIQHKLPEYVLVEVVDQSQWPRTAQVQVKKISNTQ